MKRNLEVIQKKFEGDKEADALLKKIKSKDVHIMFLNQKQFKSLNQNSLFHSLIQCFHESGCSSFDTPEQIKRHYKEKAGLIKIEYGNCLSMDAKVKIHDATKGLELDVADRVNLLLLLKGRVLKEQSWGDASNDQARLALDLLIQDMIQSGINSEKFEKIMRELEDKKYGYLVN